MQKISITMVHMVRFWELDFFRGVAIIMMAVFHLVFDLYYFGGYGIDVGSGFWLYFARATALIFVFLVGICLAISYERNNERFLIKNLKRGVKVFGFGLLITAITFLAFKNNFIVFGVLHFIGVAVIISMFFLRFKYLNLLLAIVFIVVGFYLSGLVFNFPWLVWIGLQPTGFYTFDYFPIFPWFGVVLLGVFAGKKLYSGGNRQFKIVEASNSLSKLFSFLGRHSLVIYLIHQPIIISILYLFGIIQFAI